MTLTTAQAVFILAALAVVAGLWAAHISVNSATRGTEWAVRRLPGEIRWGLVVLGAGVGVAIVVEPLWLGLGVLYLGGVVAWTARAVLHGIERLRDAGAYEPLPVNRQAAVVGRAGLWLLIVGALGVAVTVIDYESRGGVGLWDLVLVGVVAGVGVVYRRRAAVMLGERDESAPLAFEDSGTPPAERGENA